MAACLGVAVLGGGPSGRYNPRLTDTRYNGQSEGQGGTFVKLNLEGRERYFMIHGSHDVRVWEILGLDTLRDLPGGIYTHTEAAVALAKSTDAVYRAEVEGKQTIVIVAGRHLLAGAPAVRRRIEGNRGFEARVAYDDAHLYVHYRVDTPHELVNSQTNPEIVFRGGNLIDIQLAANPNATPGRTRPEPGDLRLLVTRKDGEPYAVLFQPRVEGFAGEPVSLRSPTGQEAFDRIAEIEVGLDYETTPDGFSASVTVPLAQLGLQLAPGMEVAMYLGYIFGDSQGASTVRRLYLNNNSPTAGTIDDIPHESRLDPAHWGTARVE